MRYLVVWMALAACGDNAPSLVETPHSGSRLKLAWFEFGDGFRTWAPATDIVDATLGLPCKPTMWGDGTSRCTPDLGPVYYLDGACTMPISFAGAKFAADGTTPAMTCGPNGPTKLYRVDGATMSVSTIYTKGATTCTPSQIPGRTGTAVVQGATSVPLSTLVTVRVEPRGDAPLVVDTLVGDDGLVAPLALRDARYDINCDLDRLKLGVNVPCLPSAAASPDLTVFSDPYCSIPALPMDVNTCSPPTVAGFNTFGCPVFYEVGAPVMRQAYGYAFSPSSSACGPRNDISMGIASLGDRIDLVQLDRAPEPTVGREQPLVIVSGTTRFRDPLRLYDSELGTECVLEQYVADDQVAFCRPVSGSDLAFESYSDSSCTTPNPPLGKGMIEETCGERRTASYIDAGNALFRIGARHVGAAYEMNGVSCDAIPWQTFELEELPITMIPSAVKRRDR